MELLTYSRRKALKSQLISLAETVREDKVACAIAICCIEWKVQSKR